MFTLATQPQGIGRNLDNGFRLFFNGLKGAIGIMLIMIGAGVVSSAKGMAYNADLKSYDWSNDESEMATAAAAECRGQRSLDVRRGALLLPVTAREPGRRALHRRLAR